MSIKIRDIQTAMKKSGKDTRDVFNSDLSNESVELICHMVAVGIGTYHIMLKNKIKRDYSIDIGEIDLDSNELYRAIFPEIDLNGQ